MGQRRIYNQGASQLTALILPGLSMDILFSGQSRGRVGKTGFFLALESTVPRSGGGAGRSSTGAGIRSRPRAPEGPSGDPGAGDRASPWGWSRALLHGRRDSIPSTGAGRAVRVIQAPETVPRPGGGAGRSSTGAGRAVRVIRAPEAWPRPGGGVGRSFTGAGIRSRPRAPEGLSG